MAACRSTAPSLSLFPFLSVLSCVIGTLTLILSALSVGSMQDSGAARAMDYTALTDRITDHKREASRLEQLIAEARQRQAQLEAARRRLEELKAAAAGAKLDRATALALAGQIADLEEQIAKLAAELKKLQEEIARLRQNPPDAAASVSVQWPAGEPGAEARKFTPVFVECAADAAVIYDATHQPSAHVRAADIDDDWGLGDVLVRTKMRRDHLVVFMVRPGGVKVFEAAQRRAEQYGAEYSFVAIPGEGRIDLGAFARGAAAGP